MRSSPGRPTVGALVLLAAGLAAGAAQASTVYVTRGAGTRPLFTNEPVDGSSRAVLSTAPGRTTFNPLLAGQRPLRSAAAPARRPISGDLRQLIVRTAGRHRLDPSLVKAVIHVESGFNPQAVSPKGARGLMQVMPDTGRRFGRTDLFDPEQNVEAGSEYLKYLLSLFDGDVRLALAAYNAGEGAVLRHGRRIPPFRETQAYVPKVLATWDAYARQPAEAETRP